MMHYLNIKAEVHDVTVLHYVFLSFNAELASFLDSSFRFILHIVVVLDYLCADETPFTGLIFFISNLLILL